MRNMNHKANYYCILPIIGAIALITLPIISACSYASNAQAYDIAASGSKRNLNPDATSQEIRELYTGNTQFAFDLYQKLREEDGNLLFSPFSISQALAMTYAGARGNTETQMRDTLHFILPQGRLHPTFNALDLKLVSRGKGAKGMDDGGFRLIISNSLWGQTGYKFLNSFLDLLAVNYSAGMNLVDFVGDPDGCTEIINQWAEEKTEDRIKDLIPPKIISPMTRLVLVNAVYFNAAWAHPFPEEITYDETFHPLEGPSIDVPMMHMDEAESLSYMRGDGYQAVELPYDGDELSMVIFLPDEGMFDEFEDNLNTEVLNRTRDSMKRNDVIVSMPKIEYESAFRLGRTLAAMGMPDAFDESADFSGMDGTQYLFIKAVIHKAFIAIQEKGTEAAAATAVVMDFKAAPAHDEPIRFEVDRPYIFVIQDNETGAVLFTGRVLNPVS